MAIEKLARQVEAFGAALAARGAPAGEYRRIAAFFEANGGWSVEGLDAAMTAREAEDAEAARAAEAARRAAARESDRRVEAAAQRFEDAPDARAALAPILEEIKRQGKAFPLADWKRLAKRLSGQTARSKAHAEEIIRGWIGVRAQMGAIPGQVARAHAQGC